MDPEGRGVGFLDVQVTVDREADAAYIFLTKDRVVVSRKQVFVPHDNGFDVIIDFDQNGRMIGIEIIGAEVGLDSEFLADADDITNRE